jgi:hypothetical protein
LVAGRQVGVVIASRGANADIGELEPEVFFLVAADGAVGANDVLDFMLDKEVEGVDVLLDETCGRSG